MADAAAPSAVKHGRVVVVGGAASGDGRLSVETRGGGPGRPELPVERGRRTPVPCVGPARGVECDPLVELDRSVF